MLLIEEPTESELYSFRERFEIKEDLINDDFIDESDSSIKTIENDNFKIRKSLSDGLNYIDDSVSSFKNSIKSSLSELTIILNNKNGNNDHVNEKSIRKSSLNTAPNHQSLSFPINKKIQINYQ